MLFMDVSPYMDNASRDFLFNLQQIVGNPMFIGIILIMFFTFFIIALKISFDVAVVLFIPIIFIASIWIEPLRLIFAIVLGLLIGLGVLRLIGKR